MGSTRIRGNALALQVDGLDVWADVTSARLVPEVEELVRGWSGRVAFDISRWYLEVTAVQSTASGSFWSLLWDNPLAVVPFIYAPHGNAAPEPDRPHFLGQVQIPPRPEVGGEASRWGTYTFTARLEVQPPGPEKVST